MNKLKMTLLSCCLGICCTCNVAFADFNANYSNNILVPQLGTAGSLGLSVPKEVAIGNYFMRTARAFLPVVDDPVLSEYVNTLGNRLLSNADNVNFPFQFFMVQDNNLNASAFLGGKVAINTGLFKYAETEDEFASVLAHEISHVTQRHLARFIESMSTTNNLSVAGMIGAIAMSIINPSLGVAAISSTIGISAQKRINFTRDNEFEADRIGINLLYNAGLNPQGAVSLFKRLESMQGNINPAFTMLIDHPLSSVRVAEAANRAAQYGKRENSKNPDYDLARVRVAVRYEHSDMQTLKRKLTQNAEKHSEIYRQYGLALVCYELNELGEAYDHIHQLPKNIRNHLFVIDLLTDIDIKAKRYTEAINRLQVEYKRTPFNQVVVANLANAYNANKQYSRARDILSRYLAHNANDILALSILEDTYRNLKDDCNLLQTRGEILGLSAAYAQSIQLYNQAIHVCSNHFTRERIKARVAQIVAQRSFDEELNNF